MKTLFPCFSIFLVLFLVAGCGGKASPNVKGKVTFDGAPVPDGVITFVAGDGGSTGLKIENGGFLGVVPPGEKKVRIIAEKVTGTKPRNEYEGDTAMLIDKEQYLPAKYNKKTELTCTVGEKIEPLEFNLTSK